MMTSDKDQVAQVAALEANLEHIMKAIDKINDRLDRLPTHKDLQLYATAAEVTALKNEVASLRKQIDEQSPASFGQRIVRWALGVGAIGGALGVISRYVSFTWKA